MKIPIVFAFDDRYALPASIAISSLLKHRNFDTEYDIIVLYGNLSEKTISKMGCVCPYIRWIKVCDFFSNAPISENWPISVYYRLLIADVVKEYDKIIWSDVDVLFRGDLTEIYNMDLSDYDWAGVVAERQDEKNGVHTHFKSNSKPYIYMSGFMLINAKQWRNKNMLSRFFQTIKDFNSELKMFDLDVLNLSVDKILEIPFNYCVLENIFDYPINLAPEYPWLSHVYSDAELQEAKANPKIIHYAGRNPKIWNRAYTEISKEYFSYIETSPFYNKDYFFPTNIVYLKSFFLWLCLKLMPIKTFRKKLKRMRKSLYNVKR